MVARRVKGLDYGRFKRNSTVVASVEGGNNFTMVRSAPGDEFDKRIVEWVAEDFERVNGVDLLKDSQSVLRLTEAAEKAKRELASASQANLSLSFITTTADGPMDIETTLTRDIFLELCSDLLDKRYPTGMSSTKVLTEVERVVSQSSTQSPLQWRCVETFKENDHRHYARFAVSPFRQGQAITVGNALRRALLGEVQGAAITCATFKDMGIVHEYQAVDGIQETVQDILLNVRDVAIGSNTHEPQKAFISVMGPRQVIAGDILCPPSLVVPDPSQNIALVTAAIPFNVEIEVEKDVGYRIVDPGKSTNGRFYIDSVFMPVVQANYSVHSFEVEDVTREILFLEIYTNGSISPEEALIEAARSLIDLLLPLLESEVIEVTNTTEKENGSRNISMLSSFLSSSDQITKEVTYKHVFIDQLKLPARAYNCLKRANIHTVSDLLDYTQDDLMRIKNFGKKSVEEVLEALRAQFNISLPKSKA